MLTDNEKVRRKMVNIAWAVSSATFTFFLVYGVFVAKVIRSANGDALPWQAVAVFDLIVIALTRLALKDQFK